MTGMKSVLKDVWIGIEAIGTLAVVAGMVYLKFRLYAAVQPPKKSDIQTLFPKK
jgi:hypothetical protein